MAYEYTRDEVANIFYKKGISPILDILEENLIRMAEMKTEMVYLKLEVAILSNRPRPTLKEVN